MPLHLHVSEIKDYEKEFEIMYIPAPEESNDYSPYGCDITSIVLGQLEFFFILNGDHRESLRHKSLQECIHYFIEHIDQANKHSEHERVADLIPSKKKIFAF